MDKTTRKEAVRLYMKVFLIITIPLGLFMALPIGMMVLTIGKADIFEWLVLGGLLCFIIFFGGLLSFAFGRAHITAIRRMPYGKQPGALRPHQTRSIELKLPYDKTFNLCLEVILIRGGAIYLKNPERGKVAATLQVCVVSLDVDKLGHETTRVTISSKPARYIPMIVDMGGNLAIVNHIADFLKLKEEQALAAL